MFLQKIALFALVALGVVRALAEFGANQTLYDIGANQTLDESSGEYQTLDESSGEYQTLDESSGEYQTLDESSGAYQTLDEFEANQSTSTPELELDDAGLKTLKAVLATDRDYSAKSNVSELLVLLCNAGIRTISDAVAAVDAGKLTDSESQKLWKFLSNMTEEMKFGCETFTAIEGLKNLLDSGASNKMKVMVDLLTEKERLQLMAHLLPIVKPDVAAPEAETGESGSGESGSGESGSGESGSGDSGSGDSGSGESGSGESGSGESGSGESGSGESGSAYGGRKRDVQNLGTKKQDV